VVNGFSKDWKRFLLELPNRTFYSLAASGIVLPGQLLFRTEEDILAIPGIGKQGLHYIIVGLEQVGLRLAEYSPSPLEVASELLRRAAEEAGYHGE
jgi:DNA-directed RNA polymerase alpha subunit